MSGVSALVAYAAVGVAVGCLAVVIERGGGDESDLGAAFGAGLFLWPLLLAAGAFCSTAYMWEHRSRFALFTPEQRLRGRIRRAARDQRLLELRRAAEAAEAQYIRELEREIDEAGHG